MENVRTEGTADQYVTSISGDNLRRNVHLRLYERIRKYLQQYDPGFGATKELNNEAVSSIVYMTQDGDINSNVDTDDILLLLD